MIKINNKKDILLLLLYSPGKSNNFNEPIIGRTRLVKMLFLFKKEALNEFKKGIEIDEEKFFNFFPWDYGPFSQEVYDDLMFFTLRGFIESNETEEEALPESAAEWDKWLSASAVEDKENKEYEEESFRLSVKGTAFSKELFLSLSDSQKKLLREFKKRLVKVPLRSILRYVYEKYPDSTVKSKIKNDVLNKYIH